MKIHIHNNKAREVFFEGVYYQTNVDLEVNFSSAIRLWRLSSQKMDIECVREKYVPSNRLNVICNVDSESGWGNATIALLKHSKDKYDISLIGRVHHSVTDRDIIAMSRRDIDPTAMTVWHEQPTDKWEQSPFEKNIAIVPFETTRVPKSWVPRINNFDALFVPCKQNIEAFRDSGVIVPIELIHWGVDVEKFYSIEKTSNRPFTFGTMGALSIRKGTDLLVKAFEQEFKRDEDVRLICKTSSMAYHFMSKDSRIKVEMGAWTHDEIMKNFYAKIDCFAFPTRGEGWGLPAIESLATGTPAIATNWSGICEFLNDDVGYLLEHSMEKATVFDVEIYKEDCGFWASPSIEHLRRLLRECYENRDILSEKGKRAIMHVRDNFQWADKIQMFHNAIEKNK